MPAPMIPYRLAPCDPSWQLHRAAELLAEMRGRRSCRYFSPRAVPRELLKQALEIAHSAPSGANRRPWHFVCIDDPAIKREIRVAAEAEEKESYEHRMPREWLEALEPLGTTWEKPFLEIAPWLVVVFRIDWEPVERASVPASLTEKAGRDARPTDAAGRDARSTQVHLGGRASEPIDRSSARQKNYYPSESTGIACGFFLMACHMLGLAALTHTPSPMGFLRQICRRPENEKPYLLIPVGYPADDCVVPDIPKKPLVERVQWNRP